MHPNPGLPILICVYYLVFSYHSESLSTYILTTFLFTDILSNVTYVHITFSLFRSYILYFPNPVIYAFHLCLHSLSTSV